MLYVIVD